MRCGLLIGLMFGAVACSSPVGAPHGFSAAYMTSGADGGVAPGLRSISGAGAGNAWIAGEGGTMIRLAGYDWVPVPSGSTATLGGLSMIDNQHAWAVELGGARVLAWNGQTWAPLGTDRADRAAAATWGLASNDVWVAGDGVEHWDGKMWTQQVPTGAAFTSMFGTFRTDLWAVGPGGVQHYDGKTWSAIKVPTGAMPPAAVWSSQLYDAWFVGAGGTVLHWDGSALSLVNVNTTVDLTCVGGSGPTDVWIGGKGGTLIHYDGGFTPYSAPTGADFNDLWKAFDADVYLVDGSGAVTRYAP